jgi:hypothetical protein
VNERVDLGGDQVSGSGSVPKLCRLCTGSVVGLDRWGWWRMFGGSIVSDPDTSLRLGPGSTQKESEFFLCLRIVSLRPVEALCRLLR